MNIADYTRLEQRNMLLLMGRDINKEIRKAITPEILDRINASLDETVERALENLDSYTYEKPKGGKKNITVRSLSGIITKEYFSIRELSKKDGNSVIPVSNLSSGEQRRALIELTANYLTHKSDLHQNTIFAIDEPEISLHTSLCYDQFERLFEVGRAGVQTVLTTHWYGFLPVAQDGGVHFVNRGEDIEIETFDLSNYRERARKMSQLSKGELPFDISLKSANDLVQSIVSSLRLEVPYSWILCEGSSEQIYLSHIFADEIAKRQIRLLPLGGAGEVLTIFRHLEAALTDKTFNNGGQVLALIDTDENLIRYEPKNRSRNLMFRRLLLSNDDALELLPVESSRGAPVTDVEDCLNAAHFVRILERYNKEHGIDVANCQRADARCARSGLDLKGSERAKLADFFSVPGRKTEFARRYVAESEKLLESGETVAEELREKILSVFAWYDGEAIGGS